MDNLYQYFYCSTLADDVAPLVVADIARLSRKKNSVNHITGILIFDGQRFCQWLEGAPEKVAPLARIIEADVRHRDIIVMHEGAASRRRLFDSWKTAYRLQEGGPSIEALSRLRGEEAIDGLLSLLPHLDIEP